MSTSTSHALNHPPVTQPATPPANGHAGAPRGPRLIERLQFGLGPKLPVVLQTEASECGLACLAMLLGQFGTSTDLATLRSRHGAMPQGMTLGELVRVAEAEHLGTRAVRLELGELHQLELPCILHWDMGHFVVLREVGPRHCVICDPAHGERRLGMDEVSLRFSGVALELWPNDAFVPRQEGQQVSIRRLVGRVSGLWRTVWRILAVSLALEALALLSPLFMQWVVDHVVVARDMDLLSVLGGGFLLLLVVQQLLGLARSWMLLRVSAQLRVQWRSNVLTHLLRLPLDYFARRHLGDVVSRFGSIGNIQRVLTGTFIEAALDGLMVGLTLLLMLLYSPKLAVVALLSVLLYLAVRLAWYAPLRNASAERLVRSALESSHLLETLRGMRAIRLFARQGERLAAWQSLMVADTNASLRVQQMEIWYRLLRRSLYGACSLLLLWLGARDVIDGGLSVGMLLAFLAYRNEFDSRFTELVNKFFELRMLGLDAQRLADIVMTPTEAAARDPSGAALTTTGLATATEAARGPRQPPSLRLQGLRFRYAASSPDVVAGLDLQVPAGQSVAIAGSSGCGKSTLLHLLLGVYTAQQGQILINGQPLETLGLDAWRAQVGSVMQDDTLFAGSIADNIAFFDSQPHRAWIEQCARMAAVHEDIARLPMGYQTLVGDMGNTLSGGQKQRVLLARALYRRPRVLILDEATSHLDVAREAAIGETIAGMQVTRIVVAHRPQTLASVDRVVELEAGQVLRDETAAEFAARTGITLRKPAGGAA